MHGYNQIFFKKFGWSGNRSIEPYYTWITCSLSQELYSVFIKLTQQIMIDYQGFLAYIFISIATPWTFPFPLRQFFSILKLLE